MSGSEIIVVGVAVVAFMVVVASIYHEAKRGKNGVKPISIRMLNDEIDRLDKRNREFVAEISRINRKIQEICKHDGSFGFMRGSSFMQGFLHGAKACKICGSTIKIYDCYEDYCRDRDEYEASEHEKSAAELRERVAEIDKNKKSKVK